MKDEHEKLSLDAMLRRLQHMPKTVECGLHSGIPQCCVQFYSTLWLFSTEGSEFRRNHRRVMRKAETWTEYIPCPMCCRNQNWMVEPLKPCPEGSSCEHSEEQAE